MSTVIRTPFGNYEIYDDGDIFDISDELQEVIGDAEPRNQREMERLLRRIRSRYNEQLSEATSAARQNRIRMERELADLQVQLANGIRQAQREANENSRRRIAEVERRSNQRLQDMERANSARASQMQEETRSQLQNIRQQQARAINGLERKVYGDMDNMRNQLNSRISQMQEETRSQLQNIRQQQARAINGLERKVYGDMDNMRNQLNSRINSLGENLVEVQRDLMGRISDTNQRLDATNRHVNLVEKGLTDLTDHVDKMEERIDENFRQQEQEIQAVRNEVGKIQDELAKKDVRGVERAQLALALLDEVERNNDLDRFVREEAEKVRRRMQSLANNGATGAELSAAANEAMININELEISCNRERLKYEQQEEMTRTMMEAVLETVNKLREIQLADDEGNPVSVENNFWSRGRYNQLKEHLEALQNEIEQRSKTDMTIERLQEIQKEIVQAEVDIQAITSQSVARVNLSQARMQAVSDIIGTMEEQSWEVIEKNGQEEIDYAGGETASDFREGAFARLRNGMGEEVTIIVDPNEDETNNTLGFHFSGNHIDTDEENERKASTVAEEIKKSGYEVGVPKCAGHQPMPEMESAEAMTQQGATKRMRERMNG